MTMPLILNDRPAAALTEDLAPFGLAPDLSRRLFARVHARGAPETLAFGDVRGLSRHAAAALDAAGARARRLEVVSRRRSAADNFMKYLFRTGDGAYVEAVRIPLPAGPDTMPEKYTLCISSQSGCPLACAFCATGRLGLVRSLSPWEIVEQVARKIGRAHV